MRVFTALPLPASAVESVRKTVDRVRALYRGLSFVKPEGLHITIHFFGEIGDDDANSLVQCMNDPQCAIRKINARLGGLGQFPERGNPRVLFVGLDKGALEVVSVFDTYHALISPLGYRKEERESLSPHMTIARNKGTRIDAEMIRRIEMERTEFSFDRLVLYKSVLGPGGAVYTPLATMMFV